MPNIPYFLTLIIAAVSVILAIWFPLAAWLPLGLREAYFVRLLVALKGLKVEHVPELSARGNKMLAKYPGYYWGPTAGTMYRQAVSLAGAMGLVIGIVAAFRGSFASLVS